MSSIIPLYIDIVSEDEPSGEIIKAILKLRQNDFLVSGNHIMKGIGNIKKRAIPYNNAAAAGMPFFILADADNLCPVKIIQNWFKDNPIHENLFFRVAVHEMESWILADSANLAKALKISEAIIPPKPDELENPKETLFNLARKSRKKEIRLGIPPKDNFAKIGPDYNSILSNFIQNAWDINSAMQNSPSLARAVKRFMAWNPTER